MSEATINPIRVSGTVKSWFAFGSRSYGYACLNNDYQADIVVEASLLPDRLSIGRKLVIGETISFEIRCTKGRLNPMRAINIQFPDQPS